MCRTAVECKARAGHSTQSVDALTADIAFIKQQDFQMPFQGILGQRGFWERFIVCFSYYESYFDLRPAGS